LRYLDLEATDTSDKGIESLAVLVNLGYLNLSHTMIKCANLAKLGALKRLEYLNISSNDLASNATAELAKLNPTSLRNLDIARTRLKDSDLPNLAKIPGLVWLELMDNPDITDRGVAALRPLKNLCALDLRQTHVTVRGLLALKGLHLASVALGEQPVTIDDLKAVQKAFPGIQVGHGHRRTAMPMSVFAPLH
jgi:hypothetical protein